MNEREIRETSECLSFQVFLSVCFSHGLFSTLDASFFFTFLFKSVCTMTHLSLPQPQTFLTRKPWFYVENKLRNVKFRTLTFRQREMNNVDEQCIICLLFPIDLPTFLILGICCYESEKGKF